MTVARRAVVSGRVQGVFFRAWTQEQASQLGVAGWVRNRPDGTVEAHMEGDPVAVGTLVDRLHKGPADARVDQVDLSEAACEGGDRFAIRH